MGGPQRQKYQCDEQLRRQAAETQASQSRQQHLQQLQRFAPPPSNSYNGNAQQPNRGNAPTAYFSAPCNSYSAYGPGGPRSESGSSTCSSRFTPAGSISGFDGPKDARPAQVNVGNLELGARIWFDT